ncbi:MAG: DUF4339 domain-containing protein [Xanthomonadaceae bacterium]|nr:DUF4339 domain-containing protein [Xanthomonadaceae bacterium]
MDNANEQKWFVYIGDHHEGPFSVDEIKQKISDAVITTEQYIWCEGMADWLPMLDLPEFKSLAAAPVAFSAPAKKATTTAPAATKAAGRLTMTLVSSGVKKKSRTKLLIGLFAVVSLGAVVYSFGLVEKNTQEKAIASLIQAAEPVIELLADKIPALSELLSPIPPMDDVRPDDYNILKSVAKLKLTNMPKIDVVQKITSPTKPTLVISSNLPDNVSLEVYLVGRSDTLLNVTSFFLKKAAIIQKKIALVPNISDGGNQPIPKGEYVVMITEAKLDLQQPQIKSILQMFPDKDFSAPGVPPEKRKIVFTKSLFLGGIKDANYSERLKTYHESLIKKATQELNEIKVYSGSLRSQYNLTNNQFNELKKQKNPKSKKKLWDPFHKKWEEFGIQLLQAFQSWSPAALEKDFIHGRLYQKLQDAGVKVIKVHQAQDNASKKQGKLSPEEESAINQLTAEANAAVDLLSSELEPIIQNPVTDQGLPRRSN